MKTTMTYFKRLLIVCAMALAFVACSSENNENDGSATGIVLTSVDKITCMSEASTIDINFKANGDWTAAPSATWLSIDKRSGSAGSVTIVATLPENESMSDRSATVTITDKTTGQKVDINVKQAPKGSILFFSSDSQKGLAFDNVQVNEAKTAFTATVNVSSNYDWDITADKNWLEYTKATTPNEDGSYTVTFSADFGKLYEGNGYKEQTAVATFKYTTQTRTPAEIAYNVKFIGITPTVSFNVDKAELLNELGDGEYKAMVTINSNVKWTFGSKPEFIEEPETLGNGNLSAVFLPTETKVLLKLKTDVLDTEALNGELAFMDVTTEKELETKLDVEFAGVGGRYVTFDRSNFPDNVSTDMYSYYIYDAEEKMEGGVSSMERMMEVTASDLDNVAFYALNFDPGMQKVITVSYSKEAGWVNSFEDTPNTPTTRSALMKANYIIKTEERGEYNDANLTKDRYCLLLVVSEIEYPTVESLFDGNDELREGLMDGALIFGQKGKIVNYTFTGTASVNDGTAATFDKGHEFTIPATGGKITIVASSDPSADDISVPKVGNIFNENDPFDWEPDYTYDPAPWITISNSTIEGKFAYTFTVAANSGNERNCHYGVTIYLGSETDYLLTHFIIKQTAGN